MDNMCLTALPTLMEIVIENGFYVQCAVACRHGKYACFLFNDNQIAVLIYNFYIAILEKIILLCFAYGNLHARNKGIIKLCNYLPVDFYTVTSQRRLQFCTTFMDVRYQPGQESGRLTHDVMVILFLSIALHIFILSFSKCRQFCA